MFLRALKEIDLLFGDCDPSACGEDVRDKIGLARGALHKYGNMN